MVRVGPARNGRPNRSSTIHIVRAFNVRRLHDEL